MEGAPIVKTPVFEGPLGLLLELIESRKLLINDISLAAVTDDYLAKVKSMEDLPLGEASEFVALAATLLLIKSRSLLPSLELSQEETQDIKELEFRLALYQLIRDAGRDLSKGLRAPALWEGIAPQPEPRFAPDTHANVAEIHAAMRRLIEEFPLQAELPKAAVRKAMSLEEMIEKLAARVNSALRISFKEFSAQGADHKEVRYNIAVSFLALLELVKQGIVRAEQDESFGDIMVEQDSISTPSYE